VSAAVDLSPRVKIAQSADLSTVMTYLDWDISSSSVPARFPVMSRIVLNPSAHA
jgi:hypothetical protein